MKLIDRLNKYLEVKQINPVTFEKDCAVSNGYLGKQLRKSGSVGSDILEKVADVYPDLNLVWLITGRGKMIIKPDRTLKVTEDENLALQEEAAAYKIRDKLIKVLKDQLEELATIPGVKKKGKRSSK